MLEINRLMFSPRTRLYEGEASGNRGAAVQLLLGRGAHIKEVGRTKQGFRKEGHISDTSELEEGAPEVWS